MVKVGYCVPINTNLASYRMRVAIPAMHMNADYVLGGTGEPTFFYKHTDGDVDIAMSCKGGVVYDVVNDHFDSKKWGRHYREMCGLADAVTVSSTVMAEIVKRETGRDATVIDDPWENAEEKPKCVGNRVLWFGHQVNLPSLRNHMDAVVEGGGELEVCSNLGDIVWTRDNERRALLASAVVLLTTNNAAASANRIVKALRAGRYVVTPSSVQSWGEFREWIWIGDVRQGVAWALEHRDDVCKKVSAAQQFIRTRFDPMVIGAQWRALFSSISDQDIKRKKDGLASISA